MVSAHLTLAGPFASPHPAIHYTDTIQSIADQIYPFTITLDGFSTFLPISNTNFAKLAVPDEATAVHEAIAGKFPGKRDSHTTPTSRSPNTSMKPTQSAFRTFSHLLI